MWRVQACVAFMLLLAARTESFAATRTRQLPLQPSGVANRRKQDSSSSRSLNVRRHDLYSAQFQSLDMGHYSNNINNRHSANDFWYNIRTLPSSSILRDIRNPVLTVFGWSTAVSIVHCLLAHSGRPLLQLLASKMSVSSAVHSFLVSSLGLLLVFRTNSAYQRFYEGRKIWEQILSVSRNLSRLTQLYGREIGTARKLRLRNLIAAYPYLLRHHIRSGCLCEDYAKIDKQHRLLLEEPSMALVETRHEGDKKCGGSTQASAVPPPRQCWVDRRNLPWRLLTPGALEKVSRARNRPLWICDRLGREICDIPYGENFTNRERQHFLNQVEKLTNSIGECERIHQTAVPLNYARHSLRSLTLWLFTLPLAMVKDLGFLTGPAAAVIAWLMFGIYQIGYSIEDPFQGSLRLSILCDAIKSDVMGMNDDDDTDDSNTRNNAYQTEPDQWVDDDALESVQAQILAKTVLANQQSPLPLISLADYEQIEN